jgi:hypothetical protein
MKKFIILLLFTGVSMFIAPSCLEDYLDQAPESGLTEEEIFTKLENFKKFFNAVYEGQYYYDGGWRDYNLKLASPLYFSFWDQKYSLEGMTDAADQGRYMEGHTLKSGQVTAFINKFTYDGKRRPILQSMFMCIRIANIALDKIDLLQDASEEDKNDLIAQAHFVRAYAHFTLNRFWGPMPYLTKALGPDDQWDIPRLSNYESYRQIALDLDSAAIYYEKAGRMRRDLGPGQAGHLTHPDQAKPNGVAAKAYKARALLYAASPLNNDKGQTAWEEAAKASWEAIQIAEQYQYALLSAADYKKNYVGTLYTNEQLWAWDAGNIGWNSGNFAGIFCGIIGNSTSGNSGVHPTQNFVDKYETKWGEPLNTEADRAAAAALGHYNEQDPYKDREPRFYINILFNEAPIGGFTGGKANFSYEVKGGTTTYGQFIDPKYLGRSYTGYHVRKIWGEASQFVKNSVRYNDPLMRLTELYLNYAEAANEAYGPNGMAPGATMSAVQAINFVRARIGQVDVLPQFTGSKEIFRERIKNERNVEMAFEGHYYFDIRRWMDAPKAYAGPLIGVQIEKVAKSDEYPTGYKYTRYQLEALRQSSWKDAMYYLPFNTEDNFKMNKFVPNEVW